MSYPPGGGPTDWSKVAVWAVILLVTVAWCDALGRVIAHLILS